MNLSFLPFELSWEMLLDISPTHYLVVAFVLFAIGLTGVLVRRNAVLILMSIELMLNASNIVLLAFGRSFGLAEQSAGAFVVFVITVAAAEAIVGLALIIACYRRLQDVNADKFNLMRW